ncbi:hypothetical protein ABW19_dt0200529 [Dactylella cylindrospora]|nr:hypothetical protein ABW19_dt0200529 [Dactylella cylindrospora]
MKTLDLEKVRSVDSDDSTIRVPFSSKKTSRKLFFTFLILGNILLIALIVGLSVGISLRLSHNSGSSSSSSSSTNEIPANGGGSGPNRHS